MNNVKITVRVNRYLKSAIQLRSKEREESMSDTVRYVLRYSLGELADNIRVLEEIEHYPELHE